MSPQSQRDYVNFDESGDVGVDYDNHDHDYYKNYDDDDINGLDDDDDDIDNSVTLLGKPT